MPSNIAIGAQCFTNFHKGDIPPSLLLQKFYPKTEHKYSTIEKELFVIIYACKHFEPYLYGQNFTIHLTINSSGYFH